MSNLPALQALCGDTVDVYKAAEAACERIQSGLCNDYFGLILYDGNHYNLMVVCRDDEKDEKAYDRATKDIKKYLPHLSGHAVALSYPMREEWFPSLELDEYLENQLRSAMANKELIVLSEFDDGINVTQTVNSELHNDFLPSTSYENNYGIVFP